MRHQLFILLCLWGISAYSAELKFYVSENLRENPADLTPRTASREDANKEPAAVLRVTSTIKDLVFESSYIIGDYTYDNGVYVIYIAGGAKKIEVRSKNGDVLPLAIKFREFGISALKPQMAYKMSIATQTRTDIGKLSITTSPSSADVYIDGKFVGKSNMESELEVGTHKLRIEKEHFTTIEKIVSIEKNKVCPINEQLLISEVPIEITTDPQSDIYIDMQKVGRGSYKSYITRGKHSIKVCYNDLKKSKSIFVTESDVQEQIYNLGCLELNFEKSNMQFDNVRCVARSKEGSTYYNREMRLWKTKETGMYGDYQIIFSRDGYWSRKKKVSISPSEEEVLKAPSLYKAKVYTFFNYQYSPKADFGLMLGLCGHYAGGYISGRYNIGADFFRGNFTAPASDNVFGINSWAVDGGIMFRACQELYFFAGAGYGTFESSGAKFQAQSFSQGATFEAGVIFNAHSKNGKGFTFVLGYNVLLEKEYLSNMDPAENLIAGIGFEL